MPAAWLTAPTAYDIAPSPNAVEFAPVANGGEAGSPDEAYNFKVNVPPDPP